MIYKNRTLNLIWGIFFFGSLWIGLGIAVPFLLISMGTLEGICVGIIMCFMVNLHAIFFSIDEYIDWRNKK
jgi:hypothetical protein